MKREEYECLLEAASSHLGRKAMRYVVERGKPASLFDIARCEEEVGKELPNELKKFWSWNDGVHLQAFIKGDTVEASISMLIYDITDFLGMMRSARDILYQDLNSEEIKRVWCLEFGRQPSAEECFALVPRPYDLKCNTGEYHVVSYYADRDDIDLSGIPSIASSFEEYLERALRSAVESERGFLYWMEGHNAWKRRSEE